MKMNKAQFRVNGDEISVSMPLTKVDVERREASGFATLDNVDSQGDIVLAEASRDAFERARGNVREQHDPMKAVGVLKSFEEKQYFGEDGQPYSGIYVTVYISKGAQDTWEKVLDGTLSGFSIGGNITDSQMEWVKDAGRNIRFIKSYDLIELSIVDNPANQLANVFSIHKSSDGVFVKGMVAGASENVLWCASGHEGVSEVTTLDKAVCPVCETEMSHIGEINTSSPTEKSIQVGEIIKRFLTETEGGKQSDMSKEVTKSEDAVVENHEVGGEGVESQEVVVSEEVSSTEESNTEGDTPSNTEEAQTSEDTEVESVKEVDETPENDIEKAINELKDVVEKSVADSREKAEEATRKVEEEIAKVNSKFEEEISKVNDKFAELSKTLEAVKSDNEETRKSLNILSSSTAFQKSGEVDSPVEKSGSSQSGIWGGVFISTDDL